MIGGHFATALVAKQHAPRAPLAFYLAVSQAPDLLWHVFHFAGIEPTLPANPMAASLDNMQAEMTYSHDLLPTLGWFALVVLVGRGLFGTWRTGWAAGALVAAHLVCDAISGHVHHVFGPQSPAIGLGLYASSPYLALFIELIFVVAVLGWVLWNDARAGIQRSGATLAVWAVVLLGSPLMMLPSADLSLVELFDVEPIEALSGTLVPGIIAIYLGMFVALMWADRPKREVVS